MRRQTSKASLTSFNARSDESNESVQVVTVDVDPALNPNNEKEEESEPTSESFPSLTT